MHTTTTALNYKHWDFPVKVPGRWRKAATALVGLFFFAASAITSFAQMEAAPPVVVRLTPSNEQTDVPPGNVFLEIEYDVEIEAVTGFLDVFSFDDFSTPVASWDVADTSQTIVDGKIVGFLNELPVSPGKGYYIEAPEGLFRSVSSDLPAPAFGYGAGEVNWAFEISEPDTIAPSLISTTPRNGSGASTSNNLRATFSETVLLGTGSWSITVTDLTGLTGPFIFTDFDSSGVSAGGTQLIITLPENLSFETGYRVELSSGVVMDAAGNLSDGIGGDDWMFTTGKPFLTGQVLISQVYGGGGNAGAPLTNDYVELYNRSAEPISLSGWSIQYASGGGTFNQVTPMDGVIQPGGYFLVQQKEGTNTAGTAQPLPSADAIGEISMSAGSGKIALSNSITPLVGPDVPTDPTVSDFVGYGTANEFEAQGTSPGPAPQLSATLAAFRLINGSQDTNNNKADFMAATPAPRNSSSPAFVPGADGSGIAVVANATPSSGSLFGSDIFRSMTAGQNVQIDLRGSFAGAELTDVEIDIPADFGIPNSISLSGTAASSGSSVVSDRTVFITGVSVTDTTSLTVNLLGLTSPDISADPDDSGKRIFTIRTASTGSTARETATAPTVRIAQTVADLATLRAIGPGGSKAYILAGEAIVTYVADGAFRNQHWIQDPTGGILIDDAPNILKTTFTRGDGISNLVGTLSTFRGLLQLNPIAPVAVASSMGNFPAPIQLTVAELAANPLLYQSRLVNVSGVTFDSATPEFANNSQHILTQGLDTFGFSSFFAADYVGTAVPAVPVDITGIVRRLSEIPEDYISARSSSDITVSTDVPPPAGPAYSDFADQFAGGQGPDLDFDNDGVRNGLEYLFGVNSAGFTPSPQIVDGMITWPRDPARTDVGFIVQSSNNLEFWDEVPKSQLDLSDPTAIKFTLPSGTGPYFIRIGATFGTPE